MFKNSYHKRHFFGMLQMMLMPFMGFMTLGIVEEGGGGAGTSEGEDKLLKKIKEENKAQLDLFKSEFEQAQKDFIAEKITKEDLESAITKMTGELEVKLKGENTKEITSKIEGLLKTQNETLEFIKDQAAEIKALKENGIINNDFTVNKGMIRTIVEKHFADSGLIGEEEDSHGVKIKPVRLKSNQTLGSSSVSQHGDLRELSAGHVAKAGEDMFITGTGTQTVFNQAINRSGIGSIADPLTANEHALDIFSTQVITGSLMTLMVYENLEANGELVAEGAAPSVDSRVELNSKDFKVFDFSATATMSKDQLRDSMEVVDELVRQLTSNLKTVLDNTLFTSGGDNSLTPWGIFNTSNSCETFNPLLFAGTSPKSNIISVIGKAKLQARLNDWNTDSTILNPKEWDKIEDLKDVDENSVKDNRLATNNLGEIIAVKGMRKYQTTKVAQNTLLVYNSALQTIGLRQDIETQFGLNNDDLKKRKVSFVMDMRGAYAQKAIKSSIYVDNIADAIAILREDDAASLVRVQAYASGSDATALTTATLVNTGATDVIDANLAAYKVAIAAATSIATLAALQVVIDTVNAA